MAALDEAGAALGIAVASALNMLDLDRVVLGGIYSPLAPYLIPTVEREIQARLVSAFDATPYQLQILAAAILLICCVLLAAVNRIATTSCWVA